LPVHGLPFNLVLAFLISGVLSIALAYLMDYLDPSFHSPSQAAEVLGMPVIAINKRSA
jgi:capsular polysaccharide biosynthesis protein